MKTKYKNIKSDLSRIQESVRLVYQSDKRLFSLRLGLITFQSILPLASLYLLKLLVDSVTKTIGNTGSVLPSAIWIYAGLFCAVFLMSRLIGIFNQIADEILSQKLIDLISNLLHNKSTELDLAYYDNPSYYDTFHRAQQESYFRPLQILNSLTGLFGSGISLIGIVAILATFSWFGIAIMILAGIPSLGIKLVKSKTLFNWRKANTQFFRKANYFSMLMTSRIYAKEVRIFNLATHFQEQFIAIRKSLVKQIQAISAKRARFDMLSVILEVGALWSIIYLLSLKAFTGAITIGSFVMFFEAFRRGQGYVQSLVANFSGVYENKLFLNNLFEFLNLQSQIKPPVNPVSFPDKLRYGIRFENVSFVYPGTSKKVVQHLYLNAKPGEITRIQGENGSGKTTLIKLLCRMYECTEGTITIDGINIKDFDLHELQKNISVIFQDFAEFYFSTRENITLGNIENRFNTERLEYASRLSCAETVIEGLPLQYETILGKYFETGEELSMGQWQRIALARALYKDTPILILDEPTSWLDSKAESKFYQNLNHLKNDKVLFLISHSKNKEFEYSKMDSFTESIITNN